MRDLAPLRRELQKAYEWYSRASAEFTKVANGPTGTPDSVLLIMKVAKSNVDALANYVEALKRYNDAIAEYRQKEAA